MKYMIVSDIHGDAICTEKFLSIFESEKCDHLIILGDILYHGPRNDLPDGYNPKKVISLLNAYKEKITAINGNCDAEVDQMVLDFPILPDPQHVILNGIETVLTHGHKCNFDDPQGLILHGHTHILRAEKYENGTIIVNPGSVSIPRGGNPKTFAFFYKNAISIHDFELRTIKDVIV